MGLFTSKCYQLKAEEPIKTENTQNDKNSNFRYSKLF